VQREFHSIDIQELCAFLEYSGTVYERTIADSYQNKHWVAEILVLKLCKNAATAIQAITGQLLRFLVPLVEYIGHPERSPLDRLRLNRMTVWWCPRRHLGVYAAVFTNDRYWPNPEIGRCSASNVFDALPSEQSDIIRLSMLRPTAIVARWRHRTAMPNQVTTIPDVFADDTRARVCCGWKECC